MCHTSLCMLFMQLLLSTQYWGGSQWIALLTVGVSCVPISCLPTSIQAEAAEDAQPCWQGWTTSSWAEKAPLLYVLLKAAPAVWCQAENTSNCTESAKGRFYIVLLKRQAFKQQLTWLNSLSIRKQRILFLQLLPTLDIQSLIPAEIQLWNERPLKHEAALCAWHQIQTI